MKLEKLKKKSRADIKSDLQNNEAKAQQGLEATGEAVKDKETVQKTAKELKLRGTSDGAEAVKDAVKNAGKEVDKEFSDRKNKLEKDVFEGDMQKTIDEMKERSDQVAADLRDISKRIDEVTAAQEAKVKLREAGKKGEEDKGFLERQEGEQEKERKKGEDKASIQHDTLTKTKIEFE